MWDQMTPKGKLGAVAVAVLAVAAAGYWSGQGLKKPEPIKIHTSAAQDVATPGQSGSMMVDVAGAVARPGVYELPAGSRVMDAIKVAGGTLQGADTGRLNLAQRIHDGLKVSVPFSGEPPPAAATVTQPGAIVSLNSGSEQDFETLPGIGATTSRAIIEYRTQHGGFRSVEELLEVPGIGTKTYEQVKDRISL